MRSLIVLEVEHGESTDVLGTVLQSALIAADDVNRAGHKCIVKEHVVRVDVPAAMVLELDIPTTAQLHTMNASTPPKG